MNVNQIIEAFLRDEHDDISEAVSDDDLQDMECGMDSSSSKNFRQRFPSTDTGDPSIIKQLVGDYNHLPSILASVTLSQWTMSKAGKRTFSRSKIVS